MYVAWNQQSDTGLCPVLFLLSTKRDCGFFAVDIVYLLREKLCINLNVITMALSLFELVSIKFKVTQTI